LKWTAAGVLTIFFGGLSLIFSFLPPKGRSANYFGRLWARGLLRVWGVRINRLNSVEKSRSRIIMSNHISLVDIPVVFATVPDPFVFMAKKSLFKIPFLGWAMSAAGFIPVDRLDRSTALETFKKAKKALQGGLSILIFPEETRSESGELLPFKKGGFLLSHATGFPILPMGIWGTLEIIAKRHHMIRGGEVRVHFGGEILFDRKEPIQSFMDAARKSIQACVDAARTDPQGDPVPE
jgi:1-acyl-sn-glycerol-3-phosphate acyltransferase